jgi:hypothetical protein
MVPSGSLTDNLIGAKNMSSLLLAANQAAGPAPAENLDEVTAASFN